MGSSRAVFSSRPIAFCMGETDLAARSDARPSGTYSRIRPRSRKPTAAYTRSAIAGRLQARRLTSAGERVMKVDSGQRRAESAPPGALQRCDVIDAAIAAAIECHRRCDVLPGDACDQDVKGGGVGTRKEARRQLEEAQVLEPVRRPELDLRPW